MSKSVNKKLHRFIGSFSLETPTVSITDDRFVHQIHRVLHLKKGERVVLCDGADQEATYVIENIDSKALEVERMSEIHPTPKPPRIVTLYCGLLKHDHFEWVVQKATELGVTTIVPLLTIRTIKTQFKAGRIERIAHEAAEQAGRGSVPRVEHPVDLAQALIQAPPVRYFCHGGTTAVIEPTKENTVAVFIGPEGGWSEDEVEAAQAAGCHMVSLSALTLRAETAAVVATYLAINNPRLG